MLQLSDRGKCKPHLNVVRPRKLTVRHTLQRQILAGTTERRLAGQHLVQDAAQGPQVGRVADRPRLKSLRRRMSLQCSWVMPTPLLKE